MNEITVKIQIECPELVMALSKLTGQNTASSTLPVEPIPTVAPAPTQPPVGIVTPTAPTAAPSTPVSVVPTAMPAPVQAPVAPTAAPTYTIEQLQCAIAPLLDAGKVAQIQQLVQAFGVATLMEIPKERYGEFANGLRSLGGVL